MLSFQQVFLDFIGSPQIRYTELPLNLRLKFEDFFQTDFSKVRIYEGFIDPEIGALALTSGSQILFAPGNYCPDLKNGQRLIAHELTHVIQQREGRIPINHSARPYLLDDFELENEAERCADAFISGQKHANIKRTHNSRQSCARVVQPAKVNLQHKVFVGDKQHLQRYWNDYVTIQRILTTPQLFLPALGYLESQIFRGGEKKDLSSVLLKKEQDNDINLIGAPVYVGVLKDDDWDFKRKDSRAKGQGLLAKDYVSAEHGDFTHRIHWFIIMYYCAGAPGANRLALVSNPKELLTKMGYESFIVEAGRWPRWRFGSTEIESLEVSPIGIKNEHKVVIRTVHGQYMWVALFDRTCSGSNYNIHEDWLTQPEVFTSLFLPEQFFLKSDSYEEFTPISWQSPLKDLRRHPDGSGKYYNFSEQFPKLSASITKRFIKRQIEAQMYGFKDAEAEYLKKKEKEVGNYSLAETSSKVLLKPEGSVFLQNVDSQSVVDWFDAIQFTQMEQTFTKLRELEELTLWGLLRKAINSATSEYIYWQDNDKGFGFWKHGKDGKTRAESVNRECEKANPFQVLSAFANNQIKDSRGRVISGGINANKHSYIAFILHNIKIRPALADKFATTDDGLDKDKLKDLEDTDFFVDNTKSIGLRRDYLQDFRSMHQSLLDIKEEDKAR